MDITQNIKNILDSKGIEYQFIEHEPVRTSEEAAEIRGTKLHEGAKAIILRGKKSGNNFMVVVRADHRLDMKKVAEVIGEKVEFEKPKIILEKYGLEVGGVPPFGYLFNIPTYIDNQIALNEIVAFNCGKRNYSIVMHSKDLLEVIEAVHGDFTNNSL